MKLKTWQYVFEQINKFGKKHGPYMLAINENANGVLVSARTEKNSRLIMIEKRKVL